MGKTTSTSYTLKLLGLLVLDMLTLLLVFSVWVLVNLRVFPWALSAIILALVFVHIVVLRFGQAVQRFGVGATASAVIISILFYLFVMAFTGLTYIAITPRGYVTTILVGLLAYLSIMAGLYVSGNKKISDLADHQAEQRKGMEITLQMINIEQSLKVSRKFVEEAPYQTMLKAFNSLNERLKASTPFGRTSTPSVLTMEEQIPEELTDISRDVGMLSDVESREERIMAIVDSLVKAKDLLVHREKLMLH